MGKLMYGILMLTVMDLALMMFPGNASVNSSPTLIFVTGLFNWNNIPIFQSIITYLAFGSIAAVVAGLYLVRNEWALYAAMGAVFLGYGVSIAALYQFFTVNLPFGQDSNSFLALVACAGVSIFFLFVTLDFTRGKD